MVTLVTGASGFVGWHLAQALTRRGRAVRALVRPRSSIAGLAELPVEIVRGDLRDVPSLERALDGVDELYHCAADYRLFVPDPSEMYATKVDGTDNLMRLAADRGVGRVIYTSTVGTLGLTADGTPGDERTPVTLAEMTGHYKRSKFLAEQRVREWADRGLPVVIVNPSAPVGERDVKPTATGRMILDYLRGRMRAYVDTGLNLIDVRDCAEGHILAAERGHVGERYILGCRNMTLKEILETLARVSGGPAPRVRLPHWVPLTAAWIDTGVARLLRRHPHIPLDAVRLAKHTMFFDSGKAVVELGLPQTPVEDALRRAVAWFRRSGYAGQAAA
ncbi:MAG TPA: hopanoid-associated sugar epimerase [Candidatus Polarisedimenticolaceae bacterium]|nr:hopanoid-associated sugar epimerase [Candidatus Polarisedimenticolaceae bacterium]